MKKTIWSALWTSMDANGKLLKSEIKTHLDFLASRKVDGVLVAGSTGEFNRFDVNARKELLDWVVKNRGPLKVLFNVSHSIASEVAGLIRFANDFDLAGILLLPPSYYPLAEADLAEYFVHMGEKSKHPFYLYNFPELAGVRLSIDLIDKISKRIPLAGIKQSGGDVAHLIALIEWARGREFRVFSGNDILLPESLALGCAGCIGGLVTPIPELLVKIMDASTEKEMAPLRSQLKNLGHHIGQLAYPLNVAALIEARGLPVGESKVPLSTATAQQYSRVVKEYKELLKSCV